MNKYVIAFLNLTEGELKQEIVEANSAYEAGMSYLHWWDKTEEGWEERPKNLEELETVVYDGDCFIHILDLSKALKTNGGGIVLQKQVGQFESDSGFH